MAVNPLVCPNGERMLFDGCSIGDVLVVEEPETG